jgi:glycosyltransferase involved in cell wall biosynthesis
VPSDRLIFINDNIISHSAQIGVTRCFDHLIDGMIATFSSEMLIYSPRQRPYGEARHVRTQNILGRVRNLTASLAVARFQPRVYLAPYFGKVVTGARQAYIVYDMIYELMPQIYAPRIAFNRRLVAEKRHCILAADLLISISASTASDILAIYPEVDPAKLIVAHPGVDERFFGAHPWSGEAPARPYLLYVGQRSLHKNFRRLLEAFGASGLGADYDLRVISNEGFTADEGELIRRYGLEAAVHLRSHLSDAELAAHYSHAVALAYPSEYEGFGLPVVEAMAAGTVVATSNCSSMPEVGGEVAFYFDPTSVASIAATLRAVVALTPEERRQRIAAGRERARGFSWGRFQTTCTAAVGRLL